MGGTDLIDQLISYYFNDTKTYKWQHRVYMFFLYASIVNAHILYRSHGIGHLREDEKKKMRGIL